MLSADAGKLIGSVRLRKGLTQSQLAKRAGTTQSAISRIERGDESPTVARLAELLTAMGAHLRIDVDPIDPWASYDDLRIDRLRTPAERLDDGMRLAAFATDLAGAAHE